ncbi:hypothetical protein A9Q84_11415 [Halobacteriovorax marinus]|uniref:JmjC domain-containing protein n=1 Tax=Halobacteriovorax marinus TaxID=97084 RepID=A0A1Y5F7M9_9BACT|nr:hypothetical protein A9Q84_11415 [Halobacteriovorax marinus]
MIEGKLKNLLCKEQISDLFHSYKENTPYFTNQLAAGVSELTSLPLLKSLDELLNIWPREIDVHLPDAQDEISSIKTTSTEAKQFHNNKMALLFNDANLQSSILTEWLETLRIEMGFSSMTHSRCLIYSTPKDGGTAAHFDQNVNIVLQVHGEKKWWIAPNKSIENPLTRHTAGLECDPELESYAMEAFPDSMPSDAEEFTLTPGSLLFVPRGAWHKTHANEDSLALNFTYSVPAWIDMLSAAIRGRLIQSTQWRASVDGLNNKMDTQKSVEDFSLLLHSLAQDMPNWNAEQILSIIEGELPS